VKKLILLSIIIAAIALPARASRMKDARQGLRKTLIQTLVFNLVYLFLITMVWFKLSP
jgi:hypothetical protein